MIQVNVINIYKNFGNRKVLSNVNFSVTHSMIFGITGKNGSGKSTLVKIIAGILSASKGEVIYLIDDKVLHNLTVYKHIGFVSPYLQLYEEFSAIENIQIISKIRGILFNKIWADQLLEKFNLLERKNDLVREYSSGMKQRLKYVIALYHNPKLLILDEPISNLDTDGIKIVYETVKEHRLNGSIIIATNDEEDIQLCDSVLDLNRYENQ